MRWRGALLVLCMALMVSAKSVAQRAPSTPVPSPQSVPAKSLASQEAATQGNPNVQVWVNTHSGVYHCPNTRWYGTTKSGNYMKQAEAQQKGYRPAYHRVCQ
jgi:hypothetical protein